MIKIEDLENLPEEIKTSIGEIPWKKNQSADAENAS